MPYAMLTFSCGHKGGPIWKNSREEVKALVAQARTVPCFNCKEASMSSNPRRRARPRKKVIIRPPNYAPNRARRNPMPIGVAWTGHKANFISPKGNYGIVPSSELAMSTGIADKPVIQFALFSDAKRWPHVTWAHIMTPDGFVTDGLPSEVLPAEVRRTLGGFGNEKMPTGASRKTQYVANPRACDDNPKKVHTMMVRAFLDGRKAHAGPRYKTDGQTLWVWGNVVAAKQADGIMLTDAGWRTLLTKNVLNELLSQMGIPGGICQTKHVWMLGGKVWPGSVVAPYKTLPQPVNGGRKECPPGECLCVIKGKRAVCRICGTVRRQIETNPRSGRRNPVVDGTTYEGSTPRRVIEILEANRRNRGPRLRIWYGDAKTGAAWGDTEAGHVGRSTGPVKIPLVISRRTSMGGGGILDACIVRIEYASKANGGVLYQHPHFHIPKGKTPWIKRNPRGGDPTYGKRVEAEYEEHVRGKGMIPLTKLPREAGLSRIHGKDWIATWVGRKLAGTSKVKPRRRGALGLRGPDPFSGWREKTGSHGWNPKKAARRAMRGLSRGNPVGNPPSTDLTIRKTFQGALSISAIVGGYRVERQYMGYTKREAIAMFRSDIKTMKRNPLTRKESARVLREARHHERLSGFYSKGIAKGLTRAVEIAGPKRASRAAGILGMRAAGFKPEEYRKYYPNPRSCKMCGGPLMKMGGLGNLMWYRCRNCGMETSVKK